MRKNVPPPPFMILLLHIYIYTRELVGYIFGQHVMSELYMYGAKLADHLFFYIYILIYF
jgi:hypothetical protein